MGCSSLCDLEASRIALHGRCFGNTTLAVEISQLEAEARTKFCENATAKFILSHSQLSHCKEKFVAESLLNPLKLKKGQVFLRRRNDLRRTSNPC